MAQLVATRYASALFELSLEKGSLDTCLNNLLNLAQYTKDEDFITVMKHPGISSEDKLSLTLNALGEEIPDELRGFMNVLAQKGRLGALSGIIEEFESLVQSYNSILPVYVYSAENLSDEQLEKIKSKLENKHNKAVKLEVFIDPSIIGGLVLRTEDNLIDTSVKKDINDIRNSLLGTI